MVAQLTFAIIAVAFAAALLLFGCALPIVPPFVCNCTDDYYSPVCGADNKTYFNVCRAGCARAQVAYGGECAGYPHVLPGGEQPPPAAQAPPAEEMTQLLCESAGGLWNGCASACRGAPEGTACTLQCVQQCECGGIAGFGCPAGYYCTDYLPKNAADAMGVCRLVI